MTYDEQEQLDNTFCRGVELNYITKEVKGNVLYIDGGSCWIFNTDTGTEQQLNLDECNTKDFLVEED